MHEASIALSILSRIEELLASAPNAKRVVRAKLRVGLLSMVDIEALRFALEVLSKGTPLEGMKVDIEIEEPRFQCRRCNHTWVMKLDDVKKIDETTRNVLHLNPELIVSYLQCPKCRSNDVEIVGGTGVVLYSVELETS